MSAKPRFSKSSIEVLEDRIAPALLINGANLLGGDSPATGETSVGDNSVTLVKVLSGRALVWFTGGIITSISVGPGTRLDITGDVFGDIVGNLEADGTLSDSDHNPANGEDGGELLANNILGIVTHPLSNQAGSIGNIITGGSISGVNLSGSLLGAYAGDGVYRSESFLNNGGVVTSFVGLDIDPVSPGVLGSFTFAKTNAHFLPGASIVGLTIDQGISLQVFAGNGSPDGSTSAGTASPGGSISNVSINFAKTLTADPSYHLIAGDGGDGKKGGNGGTINSVIEKVSSGSVILQAGKGGIGLGAAGGNGGNVGNLDLQSSSSQYTVNAGNGGAGTPGGAGGRMVNNNFTNRTPIAGVLITGDFDNDGFDDVLVADSGSGKMELSVSQGLGGGFKKQAQYLDGGPNGVPVYFISPAGSLPVDGLATDVDGDGKLDAVLLYKDGTMAGFLNQGNGSFYDTNESKFVTVTGSLGFTPTKFAQMRPDSSTYAIAENKEGQGFLHGVSFSASNGNVLFTAFASPIKLNLPIVDVAGEFAGISDGTIIKYGVGVVKEQPALLKTGAIVPAFTGGLTDLDVDSSGTRLLAMSGQSKMMAVFDASGQQPALLASVPLAQIVGRPIMAKFINNDIAILSNDVDSASFTLVSAVADDNDPSTPYVPYALSTTSYTSPTLLKNFAPVYGSGAAQPRLAAIAGPLTEFTVVSAFTVEQTFGLDFASKQVTMVSGDGGKGLDSGTKLGKGGNGGDIVNLNVDAQKITLQTGNGGDSTNGGGGAGGSINNALQATTVQNADGTTTVNPGSFVTAGGAAVVPKLDAEATLQVTVGNGGTPTGAGGTKAATGGAGGNISSLNLQLATGQIQLTAGNGGAGRGGPGGAGGDIRNLTALALGGGMIATSGTGGDALSGVVNGGAGGAIVNLKFELSLDATAEKNEVTYAVNLFTGAGGASIAGTGGAGGGISGVALKLDGADRTLDDPGAVPPLVDAHLDSTVTVTVLTGNGGNGAKGGGAGGSIAAFGITGYYDQFYKGYVYPNYITASFTTGAGGNASAGNGGNGGSLTFSRPLSGLSYADPDSSNFDPSAPSLVVTAGKGGNGSVKGGAGGSIAALTAQNTRFFDGSIITQTQLAGANLTAGDGGTGGTGDGGLGGSVKGALVGTSFSFLAATAGNGGASATTKGGAGGAIADSEFGLVDYNTPIGLTLTAGNGGNGVTAGGVGGAISGLRINTSQSTFGLSAVLYAGDGGMANSATGTGGKGGDILGVAQAKDFNSSINVIEAGNGGANPAGKGGAGGNVNGVRTVGFIGRPSDGVNPLGVIDSSVAQGVFSGRGGDGSGTNDGVAGFINNVSARQIAAMSAAMDIGTGFFAAASKVSNVKTAVLGFDSDADGTCDSIANVAIKPATPETVKPFDGFLLAQTIANVIVNGQVATSTDAFVFDV